METTTITIMGATIIILTSLKITITIKIGVRIRIKTTRTIILLPIRVNNKVKIRITILRTLTLGLHKLWWQILTPILHPLGFQIMEHPSMQQITHKISNKILLLRVYIRSSLVMDKVLISQPLVIPNLFPLSVIMLSLFLKICFLFLKSLRLYLV